MAIRQNVLTKVTALLILQLNQRLLQYRPGEDVDSHRSQVASRMLRFFLELQDSVCIIRNADTKTARFFDWHRNGGHGNIRMIGLMEIQHYLIIHFVNVITTQNQHIIRIIILHVIQILVNRIGCSGIPFATRTSLVRWKNWHAPNIAVKIPWNTDSNVRIQLQWLILCKHTYCINFRVNTVTQWKINDTILSPKSNSRFCYICRQDPQSWPLPPSK